MIGPLAPLVDPGPELTTEEKLRFARHLTLPWLGELGQRRLRRASVLVLGAGGLGAPTLLYLTAAGVGRLTLVDHDRVELSNLQRQVIHDRNRVGQPKVTSAGHRLRALDPDLDLTLVEQRLTAANAAELIAGHDLVIDGTDNFATRYAVNDAAMAANLPLVWGSILQARGQVSISWARPVLSDGRTVTGVGLRDLFPAPPTEGVLSCGQAGVLGAFCGQIGAMLAIEAIKLITGSGQPLLGQVAFVDALTATQTLVPVAPRGVAPPTPVARPSLGWITATELADRPEAVVLDVREPDEVATGAIAGSVRIPLADLADRIDQLPANGAVVVHCRTGPRAESAAELLRRAGRPVLLLDGGFEAWQAAGLAVETAGTKGAR